MTAPVHRSHAPDPREPTLHELPPLRIAEQTVEVYLSVWWANGAWRGRLRFGVPGGPDRETAEIFCGTSQEELWRSVGSLGNHHLRALYLSLA
jgi:hypothetical protein